MCNILFITWWKRNNRNWLTSVWNSVILRNYTSNTRFCFTWSSLHMHNTRQFIIAILHWDWMKLCDRYMYTPVQVNAANLDFIHIYWPVFFLQQDWLENKSVSPSVITQPILFQAINIFQNGLKYKDFSPGFTIHCCTPLLYPCWFAVSPSLDLWHGKCYISVVISSYLLPKSGSSKEQILFLISVKEVWNGIYRTHYMDMVGWLADWVVGFTKFCGGDYFHTI